MAGGEPVVLVVYDTSNDAVRRRLADRCADAGLRRIQWSAFCGRLGRARRRALRARLQALAEPDRARVFMVVLPADQLADALIVDRPDPSGVVVPFARAVALPEPTDYCW